MRQYTNRLIELVEEGILDAEDVMKACLSYMSESEVQDLCESEGYIEEDEDEDEDEEDEDIGIPWEE
jgi:hypothetical protein